MTDFHSTGGGVPQLSHDHQALSNSMTDASANMSVSERDDTTVGENSSANGKPSLEADPSQQNRTSTSQPDSLRAKQFNDVLASEVGTLYRLVGPKSILMGHVARYSHSVESSETEYHLRQGKHEISWPGQDATNGILRSLLSFSRKGPSAKKATVRTSRSSVAEAKRVCTDLSIGKEPLLLHTMK